MKINNKSIINRWNKVMYSIGCEYLTIGTDFSELETQKAYYSIEDGIDIDWMLSEAEYWLSCYYECGNVRCDDRFIDKENYAIWLSETGKLKRLIDRLNKEESQTVVEW